MDIENKINAITRIQKWWFARQKYLKNPNRMKFYTILKRHLFINIENPNSKYMPKMILVVTYSPQTNLLYFELKNLENSQFYYLHDFYDEYSQSTEKSRSKIEEMRNYCDNKLKELIIRDHQLMFRSQIEARSI